MLVDEAQQVYRHFENDPPYIRMVKRDTAPWCSDQMIKTYLEQLLILICRRDDNVGFSQRAVSPTRINQGPLLAQRVHLLFQGGIEAQNHSPREIPSTYAASCSIPSDQTGT